MHVLKKIIKFILCLPLVFLLGLLIYKLIFSGYTPQIHTAQSISQYMKVSLNGYEHSILIRSEDRSLPVLLYIHGGPGDPETSFIVPSQKEWEKHFVVVNWDQIGSGRSYSKDIDPSRLTTAAIVEDTIALTHWLEEYFHTDKIYLVGHSYGTYVGMKCISQSPEDYYAYVGVGQAVDQNQSEELLLRYIKNCASLENNTKALDEINSLGSLPYTKDNFGNNISISRKWATYYGCSLYGEHNIDRINLTAFFRPEYSLIDFIHYFKGQDLYYTNTPSDVARYELYTTQLAEEIPSVEVPVYIVQGINDHITSTDVARGYYKVLDAPYKEFNVIEKAAHNVIYEQPNVFAELLLRVKRETSF